MAAVARRAGARSPCDDTQPPVHPWLPESIPDAPRRRYAESERALRPGGTDCPQPRSLRRLCSYVSVVDEPWPPARAPPKQLALLAERVPTHELTPFDGRSYAPEHANASMISLNSIGAPLSHTVTRTSFMYPRSGMPTPEQVQLISSRENLSRFGVPFGDEAVRFASTSRVDLSLDAPPDFDESERAHSRQRSHSSAGIGDDIEEGDESQHVDATHRTEPPAAYDGLPASSSSSPPPLSVPAVTTVTGEPVADSPAEMFVTGEAPSSSPPAAAAEQATPDVTSPIVPAKDDKPAASPIAADFEPASPAGPPKSMSGSISSVAQSAASLKDDSRAGSPSMTDFGPPLSAGPPTSTRGRRGPPSAFKPSLLTDPPRSESRASTMTAQTFQTANDGEDTDAYFSDFGEDEHSPGRRTPTGNGLSVASRRSAHESMTLGHALEATDATIVPGRSAAVGA
ncbi:hypothetical protein BD626DRAFT_572701 [Schizophyllum amplum]|uniref:Uncharacterized protein n=1 Tax=Schizophyllum amplum TaxID=97359 RepID=A0A550C3P2_9AGAR|nr:hypothetical protein BD626DRAFT_572701 [Auriculariopsis ampla]